MDSSIPYTPQEQEKVDTFVQQLKTCFVTMDKETCKILYKEFERIATKK